MTISKTNAITGYDLTLMPPSPGNAVAFGWIRLIGAGEDAGYIYLTTPPVKPHLSSRGVYIVTSLPMEQLAVTLDILRHEKNLQIRFFDPQTAGIEPTVFIESSLVAIADPAQPPSLPAEIDAGITALRAANSL